MSPTTIQETVSPWSPCPYEMMRPRPLKRACLWERTTQVLSRVMVSRSTTRTMTMMTTKRIPMTTQQGEQAIVNPPGEQEWTPFHNNNPCSPPRHQE